ncbi:uncharacterized protein LOC143232694 [Tachypleus tridentatus]|uniref:uncharacterized protein LOC143232694 n=1 Tax=Tachypleus tridentatus TaxID=6853 RepID=UPI003FD4DE3E
MADKKKRMARIKPKSLNNTQKSSKGKGESWPINDTIWNEEEESVPSGIFIPNSDFVLQKKSLKERIEDGFKSVFCCKHQTKQERIRVWCHDSSNEEIEWDSSSVWNYTIGRVVEFKEDEKRVAEILKSKNKHHGFCIGESWPINDTIWNEEEESVPSGIFIPNSDFALQKKSLKERIEDAFKSVFCCKHQTKQERIRVWCHDS